MIEGEVRFAVGDKRLSLVRVIPFWGRVGFRIRLRRLRESPGRLLIAFSPAGKMEQFLRDTAVPNPPVEDAAFWRKYRSRAGGALAVSSLIAIWNGELAKFAERIRECGATLLPQG